MEGTPFEIREGNIIFFPCLNVGRFISVIADVCPAVVPIRCDHTPWSIYYCVVVCACAIVCAYIINHNRHSNVIKYNRIVEHLSTNL